MALFLLKQYCQKACKNVARWRIETAAAIVLQRLVRGWLARILRRRLRLARRIQAAIILQCAARQKAARRAAAAHAAALAAARAYFAALMIQCMARQWQARLMVAHLRAERAARLKAARNHAASEIQRVFRGMMGRCVLFFTMSSSFFIVISPRYFHLSCIFSSFHLFFSGFASFFFSRFYVPP
jgi:hypothetical protein